MKSIDDILKEAKPEVPVLSENFSRSVMSKIDELGLEIAPAKTFGPSINWISLFSGALCLIMALLITNMAIFEVQMGGALELLSFGSRFAIDFVSYLPLDMIVPTLLIIGISTYLLWHSHAFKRHVAAIAAGSLIVSSAGGTALAATDFNTAIQSRVIRETYHIPVVSWFFKERAQYRLHHPHFQMGEVVERRKDHVLIEDPYGKMQKIFLPAGKTAEKGQYIRLTGDLAEDGFFGHDMQHCNPVRVGKYFSHMDMMMKGKRRGGTMNGNMMERGHMMHGRGLN